MAYSFAMKQLLLLSLCVIYTYQVSAEIYRLVDETGSVSFSDQPHPQATLIEVNALTTYTPVSNRYDVSEAKSIEDNIVENVPNYNVEIISPTDEQVFWDNSGTVTVHIKLEPELDINRGDLIKVMLDGKQVGEPQTTPVVSLTNVDRGLHKLNVTVVSAEQHVLSSSDTITFQLHRRSVINQPRNN
jgi:uncharacterized protein YdeI (BOF family)